MKKISLCVLFMSQIFGGTVLAKTLEYDLATFKLEKKRLEDEISEIQPKLELIKIIALSLCACYWTNKVAVKTGDCTLDTLNFASFIFFNVWWGMRIGKYIWALVVSDKISQLEKKIALYEQACTE